MAVCTEKVDLLPNDCLVPNPWPIFLHANNIEFRSVGEASKYYNPIFKPQLTRRVIDIADENAPIKKQHAENSTKA